MCFLEQHCLVDPRIMSEVFCGLLDVNPLITPHERLLQPWSFKLFLGRIVAVHRDLISIA